MMDGAIRGKANSSTRSISTRSYHRIIWRGRSTAFPIWIGYTGSLEPY